MKFSTVSDIEFALQLATQCILTRGDLLNSFLFATRVYANYQLIACYFFVVLLLSVSLAVASVGISLFICGKKDCFCLCCETRFGLIFE